MSTGSDWRLFVAHKAKRLPAGIAAAGFGAALVNASSIRFYRGHGGARNTEMFAATGLAYCLEEAVAWSAAGKPSVAVFGAPKGLAKYMDDWLPRWLMEHLESLNPKPLAINLDAYSVAQVALKHNGPEAVLKLLHVQSLVDFGPGEAVSKNDLIYAKKVEVIARAMLDQLLDSSIVPEDRMERFEPCDDPI